MPLRSGRRDVPVLRARALTGLGEPVVVERRVLAATYRPEERIAQALAAHAGCRVHGDQESGRPIVLLERVVQIRDVEDRHALHAEARRSSAGRIHPARSCRNCPSSPIAGSAARTSRTRRGSAGRFADRSVRSVSARNMMSASIEPNRALPAASSVSCAVPYAFVERAEPRLPVHLHVVGVDAQPFLRDQQVARREHRVLVPGDRSRRRSTCRRIRRAPRPRCTRSWCRDRLSDPCAEPAGLAPGQRVPVPAPARPAPSRTWRERRGEGPADGS